MADEVKALQDKIQALRRDLHRLTQNGALTNGRVVELSQRLDAVILAYEQKRNGSPSSPPKGRDSPD